MTPQMTSRAIGMFLSIVVTALPLVIAIYLFWTIVVVAENSRNDNSNLQQAKKRKPKKKQ